VVVPVAAGTSNFTVNFSLENETQHEIEDVGVKLSLRTNLTFVLAPEWVEDTIENNPKHAYFGCFISRVRPSINGIPFIKFGTHDFRITDVDVVANVQNSFPIGAWGLQLACIEMALPGRPFATLGKTDGTDSDGNLRWNILAHFKDETNAAGKHVVQGYGTWKP
jgi:hypothetical protein